VPIPQCRPESRYSAGSLAIRNFASCMLARASVRRKTSPTKFSKSPTTAAARRSDHRLASDHHTCCVCRCLLIILIAHLADRIAPSCRAPIWLRGSIDSLYTEAQDQLFVIQSSRTSGAAGGFDIRGGYRISIIVAEVRPHIVYHSSHPIVVHHVAQRRHRSLPVDDDIEH
jgi:hypothetical protein